MGQVSFEMYRYKKLRIESIRHIHDLTVFPVIETIYNLFDLQPL